MVMKIRVQMSYDDLSDEDKRLVVEGRLLNIFTSPRYGGKRIVESPVMNKMQKEIVDEIYKMHNEGLL